MKIDKIVVLILATAFAAPLQSQQLDPGRGLERTSATARTATPSPSSIAAKGTIGALVGAPAAGFLSIFPLAILLYNSGGNCGPTGVDMSCYNLHALVGVASGAGAGLGSKLTGGEAALIPSIASGLVGGIIGGILHYRHDYYASGKVMSAPSLQVGLVSLVPGAVGAFLGNRLGQ